MAEEENPFDDQFYNKMFSLMKLPNPESTNELYKLYDETLAFYLSHGITEYWGPESLSTIKKETEKESELIRTKKVEKQNIHVKKPMVEVDIFGDCPSIETTPMRKRPKTIKDPTSELDTSGDNFTLEGSLIDDVIKERNSIDKCNSLQKNAISTGSCSVCNALSVDVGNTLVTCDECCRLYHQNCHTPTIMSSELRDPRFIFVCMHCKKERTNVLPAFKGTSFNYGQTPNKDVSTKIVKDHQIEKPTGVQNLFKLNNERTVISPSSLRSNGGGIASLAADFLAKRIGKNTLPKTPPAESPKPSISCQSVSMQISKSAAEKRLLAMKKKAAQGKSMFK